MAQIHAQNQNPLSEATSHRSSRVLGIGPLLGTPFGTPSGTPFWTPFRAFGTPLGPFGHPLGGQWAIARDSQTLGLLLFPVIPGHYAHEPLLDPKMVHFQTLQMGRYPQNQ